MHNHIQHGQRVMFADPEPYLFQTAVLKPIEDYRRLLFGGQIEEFVEAYRALVPTRKIYNKWIMDRCGAMPNAALKHWCVLLGMAGGPPRAPRGSLDEGHCVELAEDLTRLGLLDGRGG
jgi:4-hydroxy-tetrahydrodipicolinate synthase